MIMESRCTSSVDDLLRPQSTDTSLVDIRVIATRFGCEDDADKKPNTSDESTKSIHVTQGLKRILETAALSAIILFVCSLFAIPTVLYTLPPINVSHRIANSSRY